MKKDIKLLNLEKDFKTLGPIFKVDHRDFSK